jgi:Transposase DDE domain
MESAVEQQYAHLFSELRTRLESQAFLERHRQRACDFTRKRSLSFGVVILTLLNMLKRALQDELDELFRLFDERDVAERRVTKSAFSQARQKLKHTAFIELNQLQVAHFYAHFGPQRWQGRRLLSIDGSLVTVPNTAANRAEFGSWGSRHGSQTAKARISQLHDVLNDLTVDGILAPIADGERILAKAHLLHLQPGDLLLLDRGYPTFWLFAAIVARGADFCARLAVSQWRIAQDFVAAGVAEQVFHVGLCATSRALCRAHGLACDHFTLRLVRVDLPSGEVAVLASSLTDSARFPAACLAELYPQRWCVEEDYKRLKARLELENWSGLTAHAVRQDFYAALFTKNLAAILAQPAQAEVTAQTHTRQHRYQVNMTHLLSKLKDTVVLLLTRADIRPYLQALWQQMMRTIEPFRPHRSRPRKPSVRRQRFPTTYKPTR